MEKPRMRGTSPELENDMDEALSKDVIFVVNLSDRGRAFVRMGTEDIQFFIKNLATARNSSAMSLIEDTSSEHIKKNVRILSPEQTRRLGEEAPTTKRLSREIRNMGSAVVGGAVWPKIADRGKSPDGGRWRIATEAVYLQIEDEESLVYGSGIVKAMLVRGLWWKLEPEGARKMFLALAKESLALAAMLIDQDPTNPISLPPLGEERSVLREFPLEPEDLKLLLAATDRDIRKATVQAISRVSR